jgi:hypothetical protein
MINIPRSVLAQCFQSGYLLQEFVKRICISRTDSVTLVDVDDLHGDDSCGCRILAVIRKQLAVARNLVRDADLPPIHATETASANELI